MEFGFDKMFKLSDVLPFVHGGAACVFAEICTFPIDTTKMRLQIQGEIQNNTIKQFSVKQEGVFALYHGWSAWRIRQASYGFMKMVFMIQSKQITAI